MSRATNGLAANLSTAILNQDDPQTVRDGAPAYLLMLDSFVEGAPNDPATLDAAAQLYAVYGAVFVADEQRANRLTRHALSYAERAACARNASTCGVADQPFDVFREALSGTGREDVPVLYTWGVSWLAHIKVNSGDYSALAKLPRAQALLQRVSGLDPEYRPADVEHYLAVLDTLRPPALGGNFDAGKAHFERAVQLSGGHDLSILVDYANYYARTLYDRPLHDRLLKQVLAASPEVPGHTLFNTLAQIKARELMQSADDYF